ncbi:peroxidase family protein [Roseobacter ponti]|uniref:Animal haem peroxidase n=1 Tax=Roseobacter ponti TaxID=1891787 RepID=A0A858SWL2_9RHOB|nr:peroxidase family protein [Roseobacter ponti]QJF51851.1 hypothetical protein G3256_12095 [Roseobacter ponti]
MTFPDRNSDEVATLTYDPAAKAVVMDRATLRTFLGDITFRAGDDAGAITKALSRAQIYDEFLEGVKHAEHDPELLSALGEAISAGNPSQTREDSALPAAYTYLGQFIAHDLGRLSVAENGGVLSLRTPVLDLDSVFGQVDAQTHGLAGTSETHGCLALGNTSAEHADLRDLPRSPPGEAQIADARNDHNLAVAQLAVVLTRFYWKMQQYHGGNEQAARRATVRHLQHVVLYDYLPRVIDADTCDDVMVNGPACVTTDPFFVSREFSMACFRVGHSMVRNRYRDWSDTTAGLTDLLEHVYSNGNGRLEAVQIRGATEHRLRQDWAVHWSSMIPRPGIKDTPVNFAHRAGEHLAEGLAALNADAVDEVLRPGAPARAGNAATFSLAVQTLLRGAQVDLPDAQCFHQALQVKLKGALPDVLTGDQIADVHAPELKAFLNDGAGQVFRNSTPLWFYCLRESAVSQKKCGSLFGPVTGRVIIETIYAAIAEDPDGILNTPSSGPDDAPIKELQNGSNEFGLVELIDYATKI